MAKEKGIIVDAQILEALPNAMFKARLDNGHELLVYVSGKMRSKIIRVLPDDKVQLEITPYDLTRGRIIYRYK